MFINYAHYNCLYFVITLYAIQFRWFLSVLEPTGKNGEEQDEQKLIEMLKKSLNTATSTGKQLLIILDGLDEVRLHFYTLILTTIFLNFILRSADLNYLYITDSHDYLHCFYLQYGTIQMKRKI